MNSTAFAKLSYCVCGEEAIFLDVKSDRYFKLSAAENSAFMRQSHIKSEVLQASFNAAERLHENSEPCQIIAPPIASPVSNFKAGINPIVIVHAAILYVLTVRRIKRCGLAHVLQLAASQRPQLARTTSAQTYSRLAAAFKMLAPICGRAENCLPRSIAFRTLALAAGHSPLLVIGVKRDPFAAHSWVQDGTDVLNDTAEHVRIFTPILII